MKVRVKVFYIIAGCVRATDAQPLHGERFVHERIAGLFMLNSYNNKSGHVFIFNVLILRTQSLIHSGLTFHKSVVRSPVYPFILPIDTSHPDRFILSFNCPASFVLIRLLHLDWRSRDVLSPLTEWIFHGHELRNYSTTAESTMTKFKLSCKAISLGANPKKINFLAIQVTEIFDLNGKPQKG